MTILSGMGGILGPGAAIPGTENIKAKIKYLYSYSNYQSHATFRANSLDEN